MTNLQLVFIKVFTANKFAPTDLINVQLNVPDRNVKHIAFNFQITSQ